MDPKIIAALGLKPDAKLEDALAALGEREKRIATLGEQLSVAQTIAKDTNDRLASLEAAHLEREKRDAAQLVESKLAALKAGGKLKPKSPAEEALRRLAGRDLDSFVEQCNDLLAHGASVTPIGRAPGLAPDGAPAETPADDVLAENPHLAGMLRRSGVTKAEFEKHGARARAKIAGDR